MPNDTWYSNGHTCLLHLSSVTIPRSALNA